MLNKLQKVGLLITVALLASACSKKSNLSTNDYAEDNVESKLMNDFIQESGNKVHFAFNRSDLSDEAKNHLDRQADFITAHGKIKLVIEGYCDEKGTEEYNIGLGEKRADAVKCYLVSKGIDSKYIEVISYGKERPEDLEHNEAAWAKNRRAVTVLNNASVGQ
jgi:peptidoglycan-associated lipoprotein